RPVDRMGRRAALAQIGRGCERRSYRRRLRGRARHLVSLRRQVGWRLPAARAGTDEAPPPSQARARSRRHLQSRPPVSGSLMQTSLASFIKDTPEGKAADAILRKCVHCGFCNATCPTYQLLGDELDGPRGRIYLIKQILEGATPTRRTQL